MPRPKSKTRKSRSSKSKSIDARILSQFNQLDLDSDGLLSQDELIAHYQSKGLSSSWVQHLMATADTDGDGYIDFTEFRRICLNVEADGSDTPHLWKVFVDFTFGDSFAHEVAAIRDAVSETIRPFQHNLQHSSIQAGSSPISNKVRGKRRTVPRSYRFVAEFFDCCCFLPLCCVFLLCLLSPLLMVLTDDIYRFTKDTACTLKIPHQILPTKHGSAIEQWCDPNNGCPESYKFLGISRTATSKEIRRSFRRKSIELHPDKACAPKELERNNMDIDDCEAKFTRLFICLEEARQTLIDPKKRKYYDKHGNLDEIETLLMDYTWAATFVGGGLITIVLSFVVLLLFRTCGCPGQGPGKYILGFEVVDSKGATLGKRKMLLRSTVKLVVLVSFPFIVWIVLQFGQQAENLIAAVGALLTGIYKLLDHHVVWKETEDTTKGKKKK